MDPGEQYAFLEHSLGSILSQRALIRLTGEDRLEWLQGQATNDVNRLSEGSVSYCLCSPTGQMEAVVDAWALDDCILLSTDLECAPAVMRRIERMVIMEDVEGEDLTPNLRLTRLVGAGTPDTSGAEYVLQSGHFIDVWGGTDASNYPDVGEAFEAWRLERGIPLWGVDMGLKTLPPELGPAFEASHVSYTKGCYTGQEILQRIHSRGHTNWTWAGLIADGPLEVGSTVDHESRAGAGTITSSALSPKLGHIAAARLRNEVAVEGTRVRIAGVAAVVRPMPLLTPARRLSSSPSR
ncbi:MAG: folate-binding protein YgfZ [Fimbriimonas sp.]